MSNARRATGAALLALALLAAACGGSSDDGATGTTSPTGTAPGGGCQLSGPIKVVALVEVKGESNVAVDDFYNGAVMGADEINAAGGICGQPIDLERIATSATDPNAARTSLFKAQDADPALIVGFPNSATVTALVQQIDEVAIPTITMGGTASAAGRMDPSGSPWLWALYLPNQVGPLVDDTAAFMVDDLGARDLGILYADNATFLGAKTSFQRAIPAAGGTVGAERSYKLTDTDLTEQVLAMKGTQGVINWGFPNQIGLSLKQQKQNGVAIPNIAPFSAQVVVDQDLAQGALEGFYGAMVCNPAETDPDWADRYRQKFPGDNPNQGPAAVYDSLFIFKQAVERAGSVDHDAVRQAIDATRYSGVCSKDYYSDKTGTLGHGVTIVSYASGQAETVKTFPPVPVEVPIP